MAENKNQTFMKGAIILVIANILVKGIGAMFKIPLARLLGTTGMGMFNMSYTMYTMLFIIATAGIPVAISKVVSESRAKGRYRDTRKILFASLMMLGVIGVAGAAALYFGADKFAELVFDADKFAGNEKIILKLKMGISLGIQALAPAMFFVSFMSAFRGFFQGTQNMYPTAISEVAEALGKLILGITFASLLMPKGIHFASAGAVFGVSAGAFLGFVSLIISFLYKRKNLFDYSKHVDELYKPRSVMSILKELIVIAVPITIGASVFSLTSVIDMLMIARRLGVAGFSADDAMSIWGAYSGFAVPLFNMPPTLITAISISIVPTIAGAFVTGKTDFVKKTTGLSLKMTILIALPCAVGISVLSSPILQLVYDDAIATNIASSPLSILGYAIVFVSLVMVTNSILQATGHTIRPVVHMAIGGFVKVIVNYTLVGIPHININGAPVGTNLCYITILILNLISIKRIIGLKFSVVNFVLKPVISVVAMAIVVLGVYAGTVSMGNTIATSVSILSGAVVYMLVMLIIGGIKNEDLEMIPMGEKLAYVLQKLRLMR